MPNRDKTGPEGKGPMTGRKMGIKDTTEVEDAEDKLADALGMFGNGKGPKDGTGNRARNRKENK